MWERETSQGTGLQGCGHYLQRVWQKGHYKKVCLQGKHSAHSLETPQATSAGAAASEPLYFNDEGNQFTLTWSVSPMQTTLN